MTYTIKIITKQNVFEFSNVSVLPKSDWAKSEWLTVKTPTQATEIRTSEILSITIKDQT
jgi:hypothetical protein